VRKTKQEFAKKRTRKTWGKKQMETALATEIHRSSQTKPRSLAPKIYCFNGNVGQTLIQKNASVVWVTATNKKGCVAHNNNTRFLQLLVKRAGARQQPLSFRMSIVSVSAEIDWHRTQNTDLGVKYNQGSQDPIVKDQIIIEMVGRALIRECGEMETCAGKSKDKHFIFVVGMPNTKRQTKATIKLQPGKCCVFCKDGKKPVGRIGLMERREHGVITFVNGHSVHKQMKTIIGGLKEQGVFGEEDFKTLTDGLNACFTS
jgi:hypothetical protein